MKVLRAARGLTQEGLAEKAGVAIETIQRLETGNSTPLSKTLQKLGEALDVSPDELLSPGD